MTLDSRSALCPRAQIEEFRRAHVSSLQTTSLPGSKRVKRRYGGLHFLHRLERPVRSGSSTRGH
jgi:hypothetical protein